MIATVKSLKNEFNTYSIENIVSVQYVKNTLVLTYIKDDEVHTSTFGSQDVAVQVF